MSWSAEQYLVYEDERTRPVRDLLHAIPQMRAENVVDLGCGPGNSTELVAARFAQARVVGLDSSQEMIAAARKRLPGVEFVLDDIGTFRPQSPFDVIFSNAALQWVPGHESLMPRLIGALSPQGALAVQVPINFNEPTHRLMREVAAEGAWAARLRDAGREGSVRTPDWYFRLLRPLCAKVDVWITTYFHHLPGGADAMVQWFKATGLRPFLAPLDQSEQTVFLERYRGALARAYPAMPDGAALLPFPRLFIVAIR